MQSTLVASLKIQSLDWSGGGVGGNRARAFALFGARSCNLSCSPSVTSRQARWSATAADHWLVRFRFPCMRSEYGGPLQTWQQVPPESG
jgi:hypothetical protein